MDHATTHLNNERSTCIINQPCEQASRVHTIHYGIVYHITLIFVSQLMVTDKNKCFMISIVLVASTTNKYISLTIHHVVYSSLVLSGIPLNHSSL